MATAAHGGLSEAPTPTSRAAFGTGIIGVKPSPMDTMGASSRTGSSSR